MKDDAINVEGLKLLNEAYEMKQLQATIRMGTKKAMQ